MYKRIKIESEIINLRIVENVLDNITKEIGISKDYYGKIMVSTLEAVNNAILHGNKLDPNKVVDIIIKSQDNELIIKVRDEGSGFNPGEVPDPTKPENIEEINGRGIFLMSHLSDKIRFNKKGNLVTMIFNITIT